MAIGSLTNYGAALYLNHIFGSVTKGNHTPHLAYFISSPTVNGPGAEPTSGNYARIPIQPSDMTPSVSGSTQTAVDLETNRASGEWGRIVGLGIFDSSIGGNCLAIAHFSAEELVKQNGQLVLLAGGFTHRFTGTGAFSEYLQNLILDDLYRQIPIPVFPTLYAAAYSTAATASAAGTEPVGNGYSRVAVANNGTNFGATVGSVKTSNTTVEFPIATGLWGDMTHGGFHTDATGGVYLAGGVIASAPNITTSDTLKIGPGMLTMSLR